MEDFDSELNRTVQEAMWKAEIVKKQFTINMQIIFVDKTIKLREEEKKAIDVWLQQLKIYLQTLVNSRHI